MTSLAQPASLSRVVPRGLQASEHRALLAAGDALAAIASVVVALWLWSIPAGWTFSVSFVSGRLLWFVAALPWFLLGALPAAAPDVAFSIRRTLTAFGRAAGALLLGYLAIYFYAPRGELPRLVVLYFLWEAVLLTTAWRLVFVAVFSRERFRRRTVIIGLGPGAVEALHLLRRYRPRQSAVEAVVPDGETSQALADSPALRSSELGAALEERRVSELILALRHPPDGDLLQALLACQEAGASLVRMQTLYEQVLCKVPVDHLEADWLMTDLADAVRVRDASWLGKRILDVVGGIAGVVILALAAPILALVIWFDSGKPILYRQRRLGRGGRPFELVKFRTMATDAERPGEPRWADRRDPRVTRAGRLLRRTRLDELPQFLSVLFGDMSLVGPRPERAEFVDQLQRDIPFYRARLLGPPGLTGWAQVNLPYGDTVDLARQKLEYDLFYVKHRSFTFDLAILLRTIGTLLRLRGH